MIVRTLLFISCLFSTCFAQYNKQIENLRVQSTRAASDSEKIMVLGKLADYFYIYKYDRQGDSVLNEQLRLAEELNSKNLLLATYFGDAITNIGTWTNTESFNRTIQFVQKGIDYANSANEPDFVVIGYSRLANIYRKKGETEKSFQTIIRALPVLPEVKSDSVKAIVYAELGETYQSKGEAVPAFTNFNTAYDIAVRIKNVALQTVLYHNFSNLYKYLGDFSAAKQQLLQSLSFNKTNKYSLGVVKDYIDLARLTDDTAYAKNALRIADSLQLHKYVLLAKLVMFTTYMTQKNNSDFCKQYLQQESDVKNFFSVSDSKYQWMLGQVFLYSNQPDSAIYHFDLAEEDFYKNFDLKTNWIFFQEKGDAYARKNDLSNAIVYYQKALVISREMNDAGSITGLTEKISDLYERKGDTDDALFYARESKKFNQLVQKQKNEKNIALLGVERERKRHEAVLEEEQEKFKQKRNLQLMAITIVITLVFALMLVVGMFSVSKVTIKMLGYFAFISLFEFIVLLIDTFLLSFTHGEPLKLWVIKIFLIATLVPCQHFLEHGLIKFLESRKLLEVRTKFSLHNMSLKKWWFRTKKPADEQVSDIEEGTAVL